MTSKYLRNWTVLFQKTQNNPNLSPKLKCLFVAVQLTLSFLEFSMYPTGCISIISNHFIDSFLLVLVTCDPCWVIVCGFVGWCRSMLYDPSKNCGRGEVELISWHILGPEHFIHHHLTCAATCRNSWQFREHQFCYFLQASLLSSCMHTFSSSIHTNIQHLQINCFVNRFFVHNITIQHNLIFL